MEDPEANRFMHERGHMGVIVDDIDLVNIDTVNTTNPVFGVTYPSRYLEGQMIIKTLFIALYGIKAVYKECKAFSHR